MNLRAKKCFNPSHIHILKYLKGFFSKTTLLALVVHMYRKGITKQRASISSTTKLELAANFTGKNHIMNSKSSVFFIKTIIKNQSGYGVESTGPETR